LLLPLQTPETLPGPIGPAHWNLRNWLGVVLYLVLFALAVYGIWRLSRSADDPADRPK